MSDDNSEGEKEVEKPLVAKTPVDLQRLKLMKLMKNPEKPVIIPERPKVKNTPSVPEFVRNVMGSSAGAGSGEFHVYRHLRRKEYARQKYIQEKGHKELLDEEYHQKLEENRKLAEEATAKKRAKRLKRKQKLKQKKHKTGDKNKSNQNQDIDQSDSESENSDVESEIKPENERLTEKTDVEMQEIDSEPTPKHDEKKSELEVKQEDSNNEKPKETNSIDDTSEHIEPVVKTEPHDVDSKSPVKKESIEPKSRVKCETD